ncbi:MAG TPA: protein translocase subunit SecF [Bryobacteraceae bacterium]|nr:protein translocase subunit SecF [Bryobacteraceae bacterium]
MQIFKSTNFDFLNYKWPFIGASLVLSVAGITSIIIHGGLRWGIDFKEGTQMTVKWNGTPPEQKIRAALSKKIPGEVTVQPFTDVSAKNEVVIGTERMGEQQMTAARKAMQDTLEATFGESQTGKLDFNNAGASEIADHLTVPLQQTGVQLSDEQLQHLASALSSFRDTPPRSGLVGNFDDLRAVPGVNSAIINVLKQQCYLAPFSIREVQMVGPKVGAELRTKALLATLYALGGMLVYIAFRFEWIYGVAAVVACFHDTIITIGLFSLFNKEITLTVIAALLTLVGYSMNDTIVIFDRIRENLKILRREPLESLINKSVNQTLSRTVMTSGLTFLTVIALFLFGGPVLHGFSFALVVGIIIGTYSSVFVASPIVLFWHNWADSRKRTAPAPVAAPKVRQPVRKGSTKAVK